MTRIRHKTLKQLADQFPVQDRETMARHIGRLDRVGNFYERNAKTAEKEKQESKSIMFMEFANAVFFAIAILKAHTKLTNYLREIAEEEDETRTNR